MQTTPSISYIQCNNPTYSASCRRLTSHLAASSTTQNQLPKSTLPPDGGVAAGQSIGHIDGILITGDIANRQETGIQSASNSWRQFEAD